MTRQQYAVVILGLVICLWLWNTMATMLGAPWWTKPVHMTAISADRLLARALAIMDSTAAAATTLWESRLLPALRETARDTESILIWPGRILQRLIGVQMTNLDLVMIPWIPVVIVLFLLVVPPRE